MKSNVYILFFSVFLFCKGVLLAQCPSGYVIGGADVALNGDFDSGNSDFSSAYTYVANGAGQTELNPEGLYSVHTNPNDLHSAFSSCSDSEGTGNFMIINGSPVDNQIVWEQTVSVTASTLYYFVCNLTSVHTSNPAELQFSVNGTLIGSVITASTTTCQWDQFYATWNSTINTTATISIVNKNLVATGNDFAIDKISFVPCNTVLPIELIAFSANQFNCDTLDITWATASETNNDFFTIERSANGFDFEELAIIPSQNSNSKELQHYCYIDENPLNGFAYYRLKQTDFNGDYEYSRVFALESCNKASVSTIFNSNSSVCTVTIEYPSICKEIIIYDFLGNKVASLKDVKVENNFYLKPNSAYIVYIKQFNGLVSQTKLFAN